MKRRHRAGIGKRHQPSGATRFRFTLADGTKVMGPVQGASGVVGSIERMRQAVRRAKAGHDTGLYEPKPGHVDVFPMYSAHSNGPRVAVNLARVRRVEEVS